MLQIAILVGLALTGDPAAEAQRWTLREFEEKKPNAYWPEGEYKAKGASQATGEAIFAPYYKPDGKFVETEDGMALRCLLPKRDEPGEMMPFHLWRWGFEPWGGNKAESKLNVEFQARFSDEFEFAQEHTFIELFYDVPLIPIVNRGHQYDGPSLLFSIRGDGDARLHYWVKDKAGKSDPEINFEKLEPLPAKLKRGVWHTFRIEGRLGDPKTEDGSIKLFVDGVEATKLRIDKRVLRRDDHAWTSVVLGGIVKWSEKTKADCHVDIRRFMIGSPK